MKIQEPSYSIEYLPDYKHTLKKIELFARNCYKSEGLIDDGEGPCPDRDKGLSALNNHGDCMTCNGVCGRHGTVQVREPSSVKLIRKRLLRIDELNEVRNCLFKGGLGKYIPSISFHDTHEGALEHELISVRFICDRGVTHELVRHRIASFLQESTRYCCYGDDKKGLVLINPPFWPDQEHLHDPNLDGFCPSPFEEEKEEDHVTLPDPRQIEWRAAMQDAGKHYGNLLAMGAKPEEARSVLPHSTKVDIIETANIREWRFILKLRTSPRAHPQMRQLTLPLLRELKSRMGVFFEDIWMEEP
jgi:thymidylate synthase (FAD)